MMGGDKAVDNNKKKVMKQRKLKMKSVTDILRER